MEVGKLRQALDQILRRCKAAGHRLHVFDPSDISHEEVVGRGEEGIVQLCKVNFHGLEESAAIKTITTNGGKEMLDFLLQELELVVMGSDSLANAVLKVFGVVLVPVNLNTRSHHSAMCHLGIVMERGLCNLFQLLVREELDLFLRIDLMRQLARALHHLHTGDPHIIHRDVKPQNVVVTEAERSERTGLLKAVKVKLIDLGMACAVRHLEEKVSCVVGTEGYHAPEMWEEQPYTHKVDIFSLGITFLVILFKQESLSRISFLLESLHEMKTEGSLGHKLFAVVESDVIEDVVDIPDLKKLIVAMITGVSSRLGDAGYIYTELTKILTETTSSSRLALSQTPVISIKSSSRFPRRSMATKLCNGNASCVDGSTSASKSTCKITKATGSGVTSNGVTSSATTGELVDCRSKDSDYSSLNSEPSGSKRSNTPLTPSSSASTRSNSLDNWQMPKYRNFYTQTPNSDRYKEMDLSRSSRVESGGKGKLGGKESASKGNFTTTPTPTKSEEKIDVLEKKLEKKEDALSLKDRLLLDKDKKLIEQRKSLQKLEIQNKELRQQLALSNAKHTPPLGRFNPITKQIRPRSLFPEGTVEVKSEPMVIGAHSSNRVGVFDGDTRSLHGKESGSRVAGSDPTTSMPSLLESSTTVGQKMAIVDRNLDDGEISDKIKIEPSPSLPVINDPRSSLPDLAKVNAAICDFSKPGPPPADFNEIVSNRSDVYESPAATRSRKRKIRVETPETPMAVPTRKSGRVSAKAKRNQQLADRVKKIVVKEDSREGEKCGSGCREDDVIETANIVEVKEKPIVTSDLPFVSTSSINRLSPPLKKRKKRSIDIVSKSVPSTVATTLVQPVLQTESVGCTSTNATIFTESVTHVSAELPGSVGPSSLSSSTTSLSSSSTSLSSSTTSLSSSSSLSLASSVASLAPSITSQSGPTSSSLLSSTTSRRSLRQSLRRSDTSKKKTTVGRRQSRRSRGDVTGDGAVDSEDPKDLLQDTLKLLSKVASTTMAQNQDESAGEDEAAGRALPQSVPQMEESSTELVSDDVSERPSEETETRDDTERVSDSSNSKESKIQDPATQSRLSEPSFLAETNGIASDESTIVDSIEAGALDNPSCPLPPPFPDDKSPDSPAMIVCDKNDNLSISSDSSIAACASTTQLEDEDERDVSQESDSLAPVSEAAKDFIKIFGSKTYTGRKANKSPYFSSTRVGYQNISNILADGGKMPSVTTPPHVVSPVGTRPTSFPLSSSAFSASDLSNHRSVNSLNSQFVNLVTLRPDSPSTVSPVRSETQPSVYAKKDVPNLNWIVGNAGQRSDPISDSFPSDAKSTIVCVPNIDPVPSMQVLTQTPTSSPASSLASMSTSPSCPLTTAQSMMMKSPSRYHFVPSTRSLTLSPNRRQSVIMRHVGSPERTPTISENGNPHANLQTANSSFQSSNLPTNLVCHSGLPTVMSTLPPTSLTNFRFLPLNEVIPTQPLPNASPLVAPAADFRPSVSSFDSQTSPSTLNIVRSPPSSLASASASWINSEFFTLPLAESNRLTGERQMRPALASPRPSLRNGQI